MCIDNSFYSTKFSTDKRGYPSGLDIKVYLNREDMAKIQEPVCKIKFTAGDFTNDYNIKDNPDKFNLYLDGQEIEFY